VVGITPKQYLLSLAAGRLGATRHRATLPA
jgi:hypothetical protein